MAFIIGQETATIYIPLSSNICLGIGAAQFICKTRASRWIAGPSDGRLAMVIGSAGEILAISCRSTGTACNAATVRFHCLLLGFCTTTVC